MEAYIDCDYDEETTALIDCRWLTGDGGCLNDSECDFDSKKSGKDCVHETNSEYCDFYILDRCFALERGHALRNIRNVCEAGFEQQDDSIVFNSGVWRRVDDLLEEGKAIMEKITKTGGMI